MDADAPIVDALRSDVGPRVHKLVKRLKRARKGDADGVHDARTLLRRIRTELDLMARTAFDRERAATLSQRLRDLERALSRVRDADVMSAHLAAYAASERKRHAGPHARNDAGLTGLRRTVRREHERALAKAASELGGKRRRKVVRALRAYAAHDKYVVLATPKDPTRATPSRVRDFTREEIWHRYDLARVYETRLRNGDGEGHTATDTLHRYRATCRQLRFALEIFRDALPQTDPITSELHELQDQIGEMHDHHVALVCIDRWQAHGDLDATPALARYVEMRRRSRDDLRRRFEATWLEVLGPAFRTRLARALEQET